MHHTRVMAVETKRHAIRKDHVGEVDKRRNPPGLSSETAQACEDEGINLAPEEASFMRWLRASGGTGTRSGANWMSNDIRLLVLRYVEAWQDGAKPSVVFYRLASRGETALAEYDSVHRGEPLCTQPMAQKEAPAVRDGRSAVSRHPELVRDPPPPWSSMSSSARNAERS
jgi:hypothetical protein